MSYARVVALLACVFLVGPVLAQGKWTKLAAFPEPAEELLGASAGGKMYVFCGLAPGWKPIGMVYEYDPAGDKWTKKKPMPLASHHVSDAYSQQIGMSGVEDTPGRRAEHAVTIPYYEFQEVLTVRDADVSRFIDFKSTGNTPARRSITFGPWIATMPVLSV